MALFKTVRAEASPPAAVPPELPAGMVYINVNCFDGNMRHKLKIVNVGAMGLVAVEEQRAREMLGAGYDDWQRELERMFRFIARPWEFEDRFKPKVTQ